MGSKKQSSGSDIEDAIAEENWLQARQFIERDLVSDPKNHWLLARLSLTYYEEANYEKALEWIEKALAISPDCPLVLWEYGGTLQILHRDVEAIAVYERILSRDIDALASGECGEGKAWARGLRSDALYLAAESHAALKDWAAAKRYVKASLAERAEKCDTIFPIKQLRMLEEKATRLTAPLPSHSKSRR